jgi:glycopeptide antibiotics resistance protein
MISETILNIFSSVWPMLLIFITIIISMRITYLIDHKGEPYYLYKDLMVLGFVIYILCLFHVVTFQDVSWSTSNFIPFKEMLRYDFGTMMFYKNVLGNMIMFIPFGFFTSYFLTIKDKYKIFILSIITSITIETTQLMIGRVFDVDDILLNVFGGLIGYLVYRFLDGIKERLPKFLQKTIVYNIIMFLVLILIFAYLYMIIYWGI